MREADVLLAQALAQAVREVGRNLATQPRRVQGMVSDVLGVESRTRRAEIDAVVLAAEEAVPDDLLAGRIDLATALERLRARGLDAGVARFAIEVWRYALGMLPADAQPPSLTNSLETTDTGEVVTDQAPAFDSQQNTAESETLLRRPFAPPAPPTSVTPPAPAQFVPGPPKPTPASKQRWLLIAVPILVVALIVGVVLATRGGDESATAPTTTQLAATTTTVQATTTTAVPAPTVFSPEPTPAGAVTRTWSVENGQLVSTLVFDNTSGADTTIRHYEVVPKSVAATADLITSDQPFTVIKNDPVIAYDLPIGAGKSMTVQYKIGVAAESTSATLEQWKSDQLTEAAAFTVERNAPPAVAFTTPDQATVDVVDADVGGTADPTATVSVNGAAATVNPDGTWLVHVVGMVPGPNAITATATSRFGVPNTAAITVNVVLPPPDTEPAPTPTTKPKPISSTTLPPGTPGIPPPPPPDTAPILPPPPAPISISITGPGSVTQGCFITFTAHPSGFTPVAIDWSGGTQWDNQLSATYGTDTLTPGTYSISLTATADTGGRASAGKSFTVEPNVIQGPPVC
ncbi:MAG TPA: hypothetical protein VIH06_08000 [Ilumatobacteraceae bacterium]